MLEQSVPEELYPVEGPHAGAEEKCRKEGVVERNCCSLTMTPVPLCHLGPGSGGGGVWNEVELEKEERWGKGVFSFILVSHHPSLFFNLQ